MAKKIQGIEARQAFYEELASKKLTLAETVKRMRTLIGMTQPEYAKFVGVATRIITDIERGIANPTLSTLRKIGQPFRLDIFYNIAV